MLEGQDRDAVSGQITTLNQSLSQLEAVESKLSGELDALRAKIQNLHNQRAALESRIAAVWSLPNEILAHIFQIGVNDEKEAVTSVPEDEQEDHSNYFGFHILVSHVCRMFREVAIHTPGLWSKIIIIDIAPSRLDYVQTCLERSSCSGLDLVVDCEDANPGPEIESIQCLMALLIPHISRFKRFTARLPGFQSLYHVMQFLDRPAHQLELLELCDVDYEHEFDEDDPFDPPALREPLTVFGGVMPNLKVVSLDGAHVAWANCNFAGLVEFRLGYHTRDVRPSYDEFKAIIDLSPALRSLGLRGSAPLISDDTTDPYVYVPLHMERLEELHISDIPSDYVTTLISLLRAPNLQSLSLTDLDTNDYSPFFRALIGPPTLFPSLTGLKLASIEVNDDAFKDLLRAYSKITHLALYFHQMPTSWLGYLEPEDPEIEVLCPNLDSLRCVSASAYDIKKVLEKRRAAGFPISTLQIDKETENWATKGCVEWIRKNAAVEIIEPSEHGTDDEELDDSGSEWGTDEEEDVIGGFPYFSMEGFSDEDEAEDEDFEDASNMEVDGTDESGSGDEG